MDLPAPAPFRPAWWLPGPHVQTVGARYLRERVRVPFHRERIELPDGDFVDLDFPFGPPERSNTDGRPLILLLHGMEGSARSGYARVLYRELRRQGIAAVGLNFRSCSGELNRRPRMYHSGETGDLAFILALLAERYPDRKRGAVGVSLGGNALLKFLGETGERAAPWVSAAVAISVPFDLSRGADHLMRPGVRLYASYLLGKLRKKLIAKQAMMPPGVDVPRALAARGFREFDDAATAPLHGFDDAEDYYRQSSSGRFLEAIRIPTCLLHSTDDPFLPPDCVPHATVEASPWLVAGFTDRGGHVGFVQGAVPFRPVYWAEIEATRFLKQRLLPDSAYI